MSNFANERKPTMWWLILLLTPLVGVLWVPFFHRVQSAALGHSVLLLVSVLVGRHQRGRHWLCCAHGREDTVTFHYQEASP